MKYATVFAPHDALAQPDVGRGRGGAAMLDMKSASARAVIPKIRQKTGSVVKMDIPNIIFHPF